MGGQYGRTFASELNQKQKWDEAIDAASKAMVLEDDNPEHWFDRAFAYVSLGRHAEAAADLETALTLDADAGVLDTDEADDTYFSAQLEAAKLEAVAEGVKRMDRYVEVLPKGRHVSDAGEWQRRLRGELKSTWSKTGPSA